MGHNIPKTAGAPADRRLKGMSVMKKRLLMSIAIIVLTLAIAVPAVAASGSAASGPKGLLDYCKSLIQQLVADKKLAQSDADQVLAALDAKQQALAAERQDKGFKGGLASGLGLDETASILGLTAEDLSAKLKAGTTLWKAAADAGKLDALKDAIIKRLSARLDTVVSAGRLTKEQASQKLADATARIKAITASSTDTLRDLALPDLQGRVKGGSPDGAKRGPSDTGAKRGAGDGAGKPQMRGRTATPTPGATAESSS